MIHLFLLRQNLYPPRFWTEKGSLRVNIQNEKIAGKSGVVSSVSRCRICGSDQLIPILSLGKMAMTGVFPNDEKQAITVGPIELVKCGEEGDVSTCGLLQLAHNYDLNEMYGLNYGYRSGLNASMVRHLKGLVEEVQRGISLGVGDLVLDIGSNDGTLLSAYPDGLERVGIDPTGIKFAQYYPQDIRLISEFFSAETFRKEYGNRKAQVITSVSMFYDLPEPLDFLRDVRGCLADNGLCILEMSYMPLMLERLAYDTVCHEHLEYYGLRQIQWMAQRTGLRIIGVTLNDTNGGSFRVTLTLERSQLRGTESTVRKLLDREQSRGLAGIEPYQDFAQRVKEHRDDLRELIAKIVQDGRVILGYGASTKGNVLLQYCGFTRQEISAIAEVNEDKFGTLTPGTHIPIVSERDAKAMNPDYYIVFPWHFRDFILQRESAFIQNGGRFIMPLPSIEVISSV